jgi:hypothetical protein
MFKSLCAKPDLTGTPSQIEWAEQIKPRVEAEFGRVAKAFRVVALQQDDPARAETELVLAILEEKRAEVMAHDAAGYFIRDWRELADQVKRMIAEDPRYQAIRSARDGRRSAPPTPGILKQPNA